MVTTDKGSGAGLQPWSLEWLQWSLHQLLWSLEQVQVEPGLVDQWTRAPVLQRLRGPCLAPGPLSGSSTSGAKGLFPGSSGPCLLVWRLFVDSTMPLPYFLTPSHHDR